MVREQGTENAMTSTEIAAVKRYYKMNRAQLTLRLTLEPKGEIKRDIFLPCMKIKSLDFVKSCCTNVAGTYGT